MNNTVRNRNTMADILKGLCIIIVIVTHFQWTKYERLTYLFPFWVDPAVPVFVIISGYVYAMSYERNQITTISECYGYKFVMNKLVRYTIPFAMAYMMEIVIMIWNHTLNLSGLIKYFISGGIGPGSYYYPIMVQFIFIFPLIFFLVRKYDFDGVIICFILNGLYELVQRCYGMSEENYRLLLFRYIFLMSIGCYIYIGKKKLRRSSAALFMIAGAIWLIAYKYCGYSPKVIRYWGGTCLFAALWIAPIVWFLLTNEKTSQWRIKPLEELGKASYNIFLSQMIYYSYAAGYVYNHVPDKLLQLMIGIFANLLAGYIFYRMESVITTGINRILKSKNYFEKEILHVLDKAVSVMTR